MKTIRLFVFGSIMAMAVWLCEGQGMQQVVVTFDGPPIISSGSSITVQSYSESGIFFSSLGAGFSRLGGGRAARPENGTAYLAAALGDSLVFTMSDGALFSLNSVDLAEYSTVVPDAVTVHFVGYFLNGSTVTADITTDGIIDGTGALVDFQTFQFQGWNNLTRVEIPTYGWSLDNVAITRPTPEPTTGALFLLGVGALWFLRARKRRGC